MTMDNKRKWFLLMPEGHRGPYDREELLTWWRLGKVTLKVEVWSEDLKDPILLENILFPKPSEEIHTSPPPLPEEIVKDIVKEEPHIPEESDLAPQELIEDPIIEMSPVPKETSEEIEEDKESFNFTPIQNIEDELSEDQINSEQPEIQVKKVVWINKIFFIFILIAGLILWKFYSLRDLNFSRPEKMSPQIYIKALNQLRFQGWDPPLFFREYTAEDYSKWWLVTSSFLNCKVEAQLESMKDKIISTENEQIILSAKSSLSNHLIEFNQWEFKNGSKLYPGMYDLKLRTYDCEYSSFWVKVLNFSSGFVAEQNLQYKIILYPKGAEAFDNALNEFLKLKLEKTFESQNLEEQFWNEVQEKFQTILAMTVQIQEHFSENATKPWTTLNAKKMVDIYTEKFGSVLTNLVIKNDEDFVRWSESSLENISHKMNYQERLRTTVKELGFRSMSLIEQWQKFKSPGPLQLKKWKLKSDNDFLELKKLLEERILEITEQRTIKN